MPLRHLVLPAVLVAVGAALVATTSPGAVTQDGRESPAPELVFDDDETEGVVRRLSRLRGNPVLLAFLDTRESATDEVDNPDMSRRLLVFIESMRHQYSALGLTVAVVDAASIEAESPDLLANFRFDHGLTDSPFASGASARQAMRDFAVRSVPTTFLIDRRGHIRARWEGLVLASTLASAITAQ